jgi:hypothetical protein
LDIIYYLGINFVFLVHDNCNDMDGFHQDLDFGYGTSSDGEFIVESGNSYMTPEDIPSSPSGWHGPNFVHVLDRPFRLYQLSEFSVIGQLIQSSGTLGKTYVALFDENKQITLLIMWGDSWLNSKKGYFNVYFYPQNGGSHSQSSGYIYNSGFTKTGKLRWGEGMLSDGAIYSSIDGSNSVIGSCDNASRVIKYVVLLGYRYSHYNLVNMRIHDINVVADLNAHDPNAPNPDEPVEHDGTYESRIKSAKTAAGPYVTNAESSVTFYWTGWWPWCHITVYLVTSPACTLDMHVKVDLIGSFEVVDTRSNFFGLQAMTESEQETAEHETIINTDSVWDDTSNVLAVAFAIASLALIVTTIAYQLTGVWQPWLLSLGVWFGIGLAFMLVMHQKWLAKEWTGEYAGLKYFLLVASLLGTIAGALGGLLLIGCRSVTRLIQYWTYARYFTAVSAAGWKGRSNSGNLVCALILFAVLVGLSLHIAFGSS